MGGLRYLQTSHKDNCGRLFLSEIQLYLDGCKAPDKKFKDDRNHVLHVSDNFRGGAVGTAELWYKRLVERLSERLSERDFKRAIYCAGVLTHFLFRVSGYRSFWKSMAIEE